MGTLRTVSKSAKNKKNPEEIIKINVNIKRKFHKQIKQKALDEDITVTELVRKAVSKYIGVKIS